MADCLVIGGGPAGLTAAIYLARFHLSVVVIDAGGSRAASIPMSHNHAGHPDGITGRELVARMRAQATKYGAEWVDDTVVSLDRDESGMVALTAGGARHRVRAVLLATGVANNRPAMGDALHDAALARGLLRYCPVCDGFEVTDRRVGVIGTGERGANEALFLRSFTPDITLMAPDAAHELAPAQREALAAAGIAVVDGPSVVAGIAGGMLAVSAPGGRLEFDSVYPALGSVIHSDLAARLGADCTQEGCLTVDTHQRTSVPGLYAAGDVVLGLDQISHAMGEGGVAATTMRNDLADRQPLRR